MSKTAKKNNPLISYFRGIISYILAALFVVTFALYCSARVGWFLFVALILSPVISVTITFFFRKKISVKLGIDSDIMNKKEKCILSISIKNNSFLPSSPVIIELSDNSHFEYANNRYSVTVMPFSVETIKIPYSANLAGGSYIGIKMVTIRDYFGIISIKYPIKDINPISYLVGVTPDIAEISGEDTMIKETMQNAYGQGDGDETIDEASLVFGGFPGYEYREYVPGDPLKRINSKLSAKRDKLWVRLDEKMAISAISLIVDPVNSSNNSEAIYASNVLETALGIANVLISREFAVNLIIKSEADWRFYTLVEANDIFITAKDLANYLYERDVSAERIPANMEFTDASMIYCTPNLDNILFNKLSELKQGGSDNIGVYCASSSEGRVL